jgi:hypothetical protein
MSYFAIVALHKELASLQFFQHQTTDKRLLRIPEPHVFVA